MEDTLGEYVLHIMRVQFVVLILVLMEDTLGDLKYKKLCLHL